MRFLLLKRGAKRDLLGGEKKTNGKEKKRKGKLREGREFNYSIYGVRNTEEGGREGLVPNTRPKFNDRRLG